MIPETRLLTQIVSLLRQCLPDSWSAQPDSQTDCVSRFLLIPPESPGVDLQVITRQRLDPYQIPSLVEEYEHLSPIQLLIVSPYLGALLTD